jgi:hypothetical protein
MTAALHRGYRPGRSARTSLGRGGSRAHAAPRQATGAFDRLFVRRHPIVAGRAGRRWPFPLGCHAPVGPDPLAGWRGPGSEGPRPEPRSGQTRDEAYPTLSRVARRSTPERIDAACRAATRNRLIGERVTEETADAWVAAWEAQAAQDSLERGSAYWQAGWEWIAAQREHRVRP